MTSWALSLYCTQVLCARGVQVMHKWPKDAWLSSFLISNSQAVSKEHTRKCASIPWTAQMTLLRCAQGQWILENIKNVFDISVSHLTSRHYQSRFPFVFMVFNNLDAMISNPCLSQNKKLGRTNSRHQKLSKALDFEIVDRDTPQKCLVSNALYCILSRE